MSRTKYSLLAPFFTAAGAIAAVAPLPAWAGAVLGLAYLFGNGALVGARAFPDEPRLPRTALGAIAVWAAVAVLGTLGYYAVGLTGPVVFLVLAAAPALLLVPGVTRTASVDLAGSARDAKERTFRPLATLAAALIAAVSLVLANHAWSLLMGAATDAAMRSPWDTVPRTFFIIIFLVALLAFTSGLGGMPSASLTALTAFAVVASSVAALVYAVGFGFDPFIHRATESVIFEQGSIYPKPFYYIGQYATVVIAAHIAGGHVGSIDTALMAVVLGATTLTAYWGLRRGFGLQGGIAAAATACLFALPLSSFAATTPQGLANALLLSTAFLGAAYMRGAVPAWFMLLVGAAAFAVHPLAGVPLAVFLAILLYLKATEGSSRLGPAARRVLLFKLVALGSVALPAVFVLNSVLSGGGTGVTIDGSAFGEPSSLLEAFRGADIETRQFSATLDLVYSWRAVRTLAIVAAGAVGLFLMRRRDRAFATAIGAGAAAFAVNYVVLKTAVNFPFLIDYERSNYADRMIDITLFLLAPAALYAVARFLMRLRKAGSPALGAAVALCVAAVLASSVYLAYPRRDRYESSRGWSTGSTDIETVTGINKDAGGGPYVVLANQSVSAAAIERFGFRRYFESHDPAAPGPVFFYPVPTGGPLYAVFLDMNADLGAAATARRAMDLAGVDTAYYVVNHYWWDARRITANARKEANAWWSVDDKAWVFKYTGR